MEKMWSPWRSAYIDSFNKDAKDEGCVFCAAQKCDIHDEKSLVVFKGLYTFIVLNLYPYNNGHMMVVPYRHLSSFTELTQEENSDIMQNLQVASKALAEVMKPQGFNIGANIGKAAGAGIDTHLHFHVVPRWNGDTNFMPALGEVKVISQDLLTTKNNIIKAIDGILSL
jgi:ATP adenylyltransferase